MAHTAEHYAAVLSFAERRDFELIVRSAKDCGWLDDDSMLTAIPEDQHVTITSITHQQKYSHEYEWNSRWLYQFLHDLAHGKWKTLQ